MLSNTYYKRTLTCSPFMFYFSNARYLNPNALSPIGLTVFYVGHFKLGSKYAETVC